MKNWKKLAGLVAVMTVVMILLTACGGGNIEGTWRIVKTAGKGCGSAIPSGIHSRHL